MKTIIIGIKSKEDFFLAVNYFKGKVTTWFSGVSLDDEEQIKIGLTRHGSFGIRIDSDNTLLRGADKFYINDYDNENIITIKELKIQELLK